MLSFGILKESKINRNFHKRSIAFLCTIIYLLIDLFLNCRCRPFLFCPSLSLTTGNGLFHVFFTYISLLLLFTFVKCLHSFYVTNFPKWWFVNAKIQTTKKLFLFINWALNELVLQQVEKSWILTRSSLKRDYVPD